MARAAGQGVRPIVLTYDGTLHLLRGSHKGWRGRAGSGPSSRLPGEDVRGYVEAISSTWTATARGSGR